MNFSNFTTNVTPYFDESYVHRTLIQFHIESVISLATNGLLFYLILKHTPPSMGPYKYYLINVTIWSTVFDIYTSAIYSPLVLFPAPVICTKGPFEHVLKDSKYGIPLMLAFHPILTSFCGCSVMACQFYRLALFTDKMHIFHSKPNFILQIFLHCSVGIPSGLMFYFLQIEANNKEAEIALEYPDIYPFYKANTCGSGSINSTLSQISGLTAAGGYVILATSAVGLYVATMTYLNRQKSSMSQMTYKLHKRMIIISTVQLMLPLLTMLLPFTTIIVCIFFLRVRIKALNPWIFGIFSTHSTFNALLLIFAVKSYYQAAFNMIPFIGRFKIGQSSSAIVSVTQ